MSTELETQTEARTGARQLRVLLVEDNPDDAFLLGRHLGKNGFALEMTRVETPAEMMAALDPGAGVGLPEIVLADYNLPSFSGPAALQMVKTAGLDIPFIMMSGAISEETAVESMRAGAQDYVTKQNLVRLVPAIERELREAGARKNKLAAEMALRQSEARFHRLVEAMPLGLLISDSAGRIVYANGAVERLLGYANGSMVGGGVTLDSLCPTLETAYAGSEQDPEQAGSKGLSVAGEPFEAVCMTAAGQAVDVLIGVALLNPESTDEDRQMAAFIVDVTLQKKSEEVLRRTEKLAVAGRLAASIAHEINNPLEAITNCLYLVGATQLPEDARTFLELAQKELDRVAQITVQTLRFYRRSTQTAHADIHELLGTVLALLDSRMRRMQIEVAREFGEIPPILVHDGEIRQVLVNLIGNAIDALGEKGTLRLRTSAGTDWATGRRGVRITVADNGSGMDEGTLKRIFEPFFSTKGITGTGLGLWVSREIVDKHQGTLRVRSKPRAEGRAGGTVFRLFIPDLSVPGSADSGQGGIAEGLVAPPLAAEAGRPL
jgi:PAS domain S-box-containing protein